MKADEQTSRARTGSVRELSPEPMNGTDAALWEIERDPSLRTTVVSVLLLDREITRPRLVRALDEASRLIPRLRQRVAEPALGIGVPQWVLADDFDVGDHISVHVADDEDHLHLDGILDTAAVAAVEPFDRSRPLWNCEYIGGLDPDLDGGSAVLIIKVHHSLADGVGGVALLDALFDAKRRVKARDVDTLPDWVAGKSSSGPAAPVGTALRNVSGISARAARAALNVSAHPVRTATSAVASGTSALRLLAPSGEVLSPLFTKRGAARRLGIHECDLSRLHDAAAKHGCSINHLFFAGVLGGVSAYHHEQGAALAELRVTMPVNFRRKDGPAAGNQWAPVRFRVPADIDDPVTRMRRLRSLTTRSRREPALGFTHSLAGVVQLLPGSLSSGIVSGMMRGVDVILTNVPGLAEPRYLAGARVERIFPFAPTAGSAFNVALLSHGDNACFGIVADTEAVGDTSGLFRMVFEGIDEAIAAAEATPADPTEEPDERSLGEESAVVPARLSALDEGFLRLESPNTPMHLGGLFIVDGAPLRDEGGNLRIDDIRQHIDARLSKAPLYLKRLAEIPLRQGRPLWVDDPDFDITDHVRTATLDAPDHLLPFIADINADQLERDHPLWEMWFVDGLENGDVAILEKVHHALVDGVSSVDLAATLFDLAPDPQPDQPVRRHIVEPVSDWRNLTGAWWDRASDPIGVARRAVSAIVSAPATVVAQTREIVDGVSDMLGPAALAPESMLNCPVGPLRDIETVALEFSDITAIRDAHGGSANDVALTVIAGGLRAWLLAHGERLPELHAFCPVSARDAGAGSIGGNHVGAMLIPLPLGEPDQVRRLHIVRERTNRAKGRHDGEGIARVLDAFDHLPAISGPALRTMIAHQPFANLVVTNVPGPRQPLWFLGAPVRNVVPIVPLGANTTLGIALLSYDDQLVVGLHADPENCPELRLLADAILEDFSKLATR